MPPTTITATTSSGIHARLSKLIIAIPTTHRFLEDRGSANGDLRV
jgi:hypothetical protein